MRLEGWEPPVAIAHRGSRLLWPENTMAAFQGAIDLGVAHLEVDLRLTADNVVVCMHDETVDRTTNGHGPVASLTYEAVSRLDAGYRHRADGFPFRGAGLRVPTLEEAITTFPDARFVADLKEDALSARLARLIDDLGVHDRLIVGSFSDRRLAEFRSLSNDRVPTSTGRATATSWVLASKVGRGVEGPARALQLPLQMRGVPVVTRRLVDLAHARGLDVHVWTVNHSEEMDELLDLGVDGLITDRPDILKSVLQSRGQWRGG